MYIRYLASYRNSASGVDETGIFRSADFVRDHSEIGEDAKTELQTLITWFDENLPVPAFYDDPAKRREDNHVYFWFKISADEIIGKMEELCAIVESHGVSVKRLRAGEAPGKLVFEDECQVAVLTPGNFAGIK
jgi:hypothetical protein